MKYLPYMKALKGVTDVYINALNALIHGELQEDLISPCSRIFNFLEPEIISVFFQMEKQFLKRMVRNKKNIQLNKHLII